MLVFASSAWGQADPSAAPQETTQNQGGVQTTRNEQGDIIVTARHYVPQGSLTASKTDIPLIETPQSVSVITRDQIDLLSFVDTQQAVRYTAGAFGENYGPDPRYDFVTVRGFTPRQYIDGLAVPATTTISSTGVDLYAFQSLDILKGPSSALYGLAPPGGILNETSRRPSNVFGGEFQGKFGTDNFAELATTLTGPVSPMLDVRFTGLYRHADSEAVTPGAVATSSPAPAGAVAEVPQPAASRSPSAPLPDAPDAEAGKPALPTSAARAQPNNVALRNGMERPFWVSGSKRCAG